MASDLAEKLMNIEAFSPEEEAGFNARSRPLLKTIFLEAQSGFCLICSRGYSSQRVDPK